MSDEPQGRRPRADDVPQSRAEVTAQRRRRRDSEDRTADPTLRRFNVSADVLDLDKYVYRAAVDEGNRLYELTERGDYEFVSVTGEKSTQGAEGVAKYFAGTKVDGSPKLAYLLREPKQFADEDRARAVAKIDAEEQATLRSAPSGEAPDKSYTPKR